MSLPDIKLDDRKFQDIVDQARRLIPRYCPEWTDHNLSDPGITLIELFAHMTEIILYRLNRVPEKNYLKFLNLIGLTLQPAAPARTDITFTLSAVQNNPVLISAGTEVSTVRTETEDAIVFCTERDLAILVPTLHYLQVSHGVDHYEQYPSVLRDPEDAVDIFQEPPQPGDVLYLGFQENLSAHQLLISLDAKKVEGVGVDPNNPPLRWETWNPSRKTWMSCEVESDTSGGFNRNGEVILHLPMGGDLLSINELYGFWLRCRFIKPAKGQPGYSNSPKLSNIQVKSLGGTVVATHSMKVRDDILGISNGKPGQVFTTRSKPLLPRGLKDYVEVIQPGNEVVRLHEVDDFAASDPDDPHYVVDEAMGEVRFGPSIRKQSGQLHQYGMVPMESSEIRFRQYRFGGGVIGNVGASTLTVLKSSIAYVGRVRNHKNAVGGADAENVEQAKLRGPRLIKTINRAVSATDYEYLARQSSPAIARAMCVQPTSYDAADISPGLVQLYLVPALKENLLRPTLNHLQINDHMKEEVYRFLNPRRLLTTMLIIKTPVYIPVTMELLFKATDGQEPEEATRTVIESLYRYLHPLQGGIDQNGWPFGKEIFRPEIFAHLQQMEEVEYVERLKLFKLDGKKGKRLKEEERIDLEQWCLPLAIDFKVLLKEE